MAFATTCSISRCELTPTVFRNLRMLRLKVSWSVIASVRTRSPAARRPSCAGACHACLARIRACGRPRLATPSAPDRRHLRQVEATLLRVGANTVRRQRGQAGVFDRAADSEVIERLETEVRESEH